jgi:alpha-L-fucosidase 2
VTDPSQLRFRSAAEAWTEALPVGNGKTGAMLFAGYPVERLQINDGTAWSGSPASAEREPRLEPAVARSAVAAARRALEVDDFATAERQLKRVQHTYSQTYLPFVDLTVSIADAKGPVEIERVLDLETAIHRSQVLTPGGQVGRSTFASHPDGVLVHEVVLTGRSRAVEIALTSPLRVLAATAPSGRLEIGLQMPSDVAPSHDLAAKPVRYDDGPSLRGGCVVTIEHDGRWTPLDGASARIEGASRLLLLVATETTAQGVGQLPAGEVADALSSARARSGAAAVEGLSTLRARHAQDWSALFSRSRVRFGRTGTEPLDERWRSARASGRPVDGDPGLISLLGDFGRYLLISSSREGGAPVTLQGLWNESLQPAWSSNYTININLQMSYWAAEPYGLVECLPPLFALIDALATTGTRTAREIYDRPGWVAHHNTDFWAYSLPVGAGRHDPKWAFWPLGGAWLVRHLFERIRHGGDRRFARDQAWPAVRGATLFVLSWLVEQEDGTLGTSPSTSPENQFTGTDGEPRSVARSSSSDLFIIGDLLDFVVAIADAAGVEDEVVRAATRARARLHRPRIASDGTVQEWAADFSMPDPTHRHLSPLHFLHPGERALDDAWRAAASRTLDVRGDESTGWSLAWKLLMRARLHQPEHVENLLQLYVRDMTVDRGEWVGGLYPNMFSAHPPFQIDGNLGLTAALAELVVQSHQDVIELLPAMPATFGPGTAHGLVARPGVIVDVDWSLRDGVVALERALLRAGTGGLSSCRVRWADETVEIDLSQGPVTLHAGDFTGTPTLAQPSR